MSDIIRYGKIMEEAGFTRKQAETSMSIWTEIMEEKLASKDDLKFLGSEMSHEFRNVRSEMAHEFRNMRQEMAQEFKNVRQEMAIEIQKLRQEMAQEFKNVRHEFRQELLQLEHRLTLRMGAMSVATIGILGTLMTLLHRSG